MTSGHQKVIIAEWMGWKWYRYQHAHQRQRGLNWSDSWRVRLLRSKPNGFRIRNVRQLKEQPQSHEPVELPSFFDLLNLDEVIKSIEFQK